MYKLNKKQERFISEYLKDLNATQAYIRAGYSARTANICGPRLLSNVSIKTEIERLTTEKAAEAGVTVDKIVKEAALIAFSDLSEFLQNSEDIKDPSKWPEHVRRGLQSYKITKQSGGKTETTRTEVKLWDKVACLEFLGRYLGMLKDKGDQAQIIFVQADDVKRKAP